MFYDGQRVDEIQGSNNFGLILALASGSAVLPSVTGQGAQGEQDPQRPEVIKVDTALVTVPVVVTDRYGQFVSGLSRNDFRMQENSEPQQIASFSSAEAPFNVALLIDTSRSTRNKLGAIRKAALNFIKQLQPNDRVLIVTFDEKSLQIIFGPSHPNPARSISAPRALKAPLTPLPSSQTNCDTNTHWPITRPTINATAASGQ